MNRHHADPELGLLLRDFLESGLMRAGSPEHGVVEKVIARGIAALSSAEFGVWEGKVLPIVSKPLQEQQAIARIVAKGGKVPRKIGL